MSDFNWECPRCGATTSVDESPDGELCEECYYAEDEEPDEEEEN